MYRYGGEGRWGGIPSSYYLEDNSVTAPLTQEDEEYIEAHELNLLRGSFAPETLMPHEEPFSLEHRRDVAHDRLNVLTGGTRTTVTPYLADGADLSFLERWRDGRAAGNMAPVLRDSVPDAERRFSRRDFLPDTGAAQQVTTYNPAPFTEKLRHKQALFFDQQARARFENSELIQFTSGVGNAKSLMKARQAKTNGAGRLSDGVSFDGDIARDDPTLVDAWQSTPDRIRDTSDVPVGWRYIVPSAAFDQGSVALASKRHLGRLAKADPARQRIMTGYETLYTPQDKAAGNRRNVVRSMAGAMKDATNARKQVMKAEEKSSSNNFKDDAEVSRHAAMQRKDALAYASAMALTAEATVDKDATAISSHVSGNQQAALAARTLPATSRNTVESAELADAMRISSKSGARDKDTLAAAKVAQKITTSTGADDLNAETRHLRRQGKTDNLLRQKIRSQSTQRFQGDLMNIAKYQNSRRLSKKAVRGQLANGQSIDRNYMDATVDENLANRMRRGEVNIHGAQEIGPVLEDRDRAASAHGNGAYSLNVGAGREASTVDQSLDDYTTELI